MAILSPSKPIKILAHNDVSQTSRFDLFRAAITIPSFRFIALECSHHTYSHTESLFSMALRGGLYRRVVIENAKFFWRQRRTNSGLSGSNAGGLEGAPCPRFSSPGGPPLDMTSSGRPCGGHCSSHFMKRHPVAA
jgi:hypothetical protein